MALSSVAEAQRETDEARDTSVTDDANLQEPSAEDEEDAQNGALGIASEIPRESFSSTRAEIDNKEGDLTPMPSAVHHIPATAGTAAQSLAAVFIPPPPPSDDPSALKSESITPTTPTEPSRPPRSAERGMSATDLGLKPGQIRVKPKNGTRPTTPASLQLTPSTLETEIDSAVIPPTPAEFGAIGRTTQSMLSVNSTTSNGTVNGTAVHLNGTPNKGMLSASSSASTADEMILSPPGTPADRMSIAGSEESIARRHSADFKTMREVPAEAKKASRLSTGTVAFGPM